MEIEIKLSNGREVKKITNRAGDCEIKACDGKPLSKEERDEFCRQSVSQFIAANNRRRADRAHG